MRVVDKWRWSVREVLLYKYRSKINVNIGICHKLNALMPYGPNAFLTTPRQSSACRTVNNYTGPSIYGPVTSCCVPSYWRGTRTKQEFTRQQ